MERRSLLKLLIGGVLAPLVGVNPMANPQRSWTITIGEAQDIWKIRIVWQGNLINQSRVLKRSYRRIA